MKNINYLSILLCLISTNVFGNIGCGRAATINQQTVLIDSGSQCKGEGLRFYLEKDPVALKYLENYQKGQEINSFRAGLSMAGTGMLIGGLLLADDDNKGIFQRDTLIYSGALFILVSYILTKTHNHNNERHLENSIREYNKRNMPQIEFAPIYNKRQTGYDLGIKLKIATY